MGYNVNKLKRVCKIFMTIFFKFTAIYFLIIGFGIIFTKEIHYGVISALCAVVGYLLLDVKIEE